MEFKEIHKKGAESSTKYELQMTPSNLQYDNYHNYLQFVTIFCL